MPTNEELQKRILDALEAIAADVRALNFGDDPQPIPVSSDAAAVAKIRTGEAIQIVPRRNGTWRVDWRAAQKAHMGPEKPSIAEALAAVQNDPTFPTLPGERPLNPDEVKALDRLEALGDRGSCSVRFEGARATFADHNWGNPAGKHQKFGGQGMLLEPIAYLEREHG